MRRYAIDFYSGYLEDVLQAIGSRDVTLVTRFLRIGDHTRARLGLAEDMMDGWKEAVEALLMEPKRALKTDADHLAFASLMLDAGQRRFRIFFDEGDESGVRNIFSFLGHPEVGDHLLNSDFRGYQSTSKRIRWGFMDVTEVETILKDLYPGDILKSPCTAAIAGRLSQHSRQAAEEMLIEVGIETQNSVSHNIDYLIIGSKGTGGTKHDKVRVLQDKGYDIAVLDEDGFEKLLRSPRPAPPEWSTTLNKQYEQFIHALRHIWAFEMDLYTLIYEYDPDPESSL